MENISNSGIGSIDPYYRYKMPKMVINNKKNHTIIENIDDLSGALKRETSELLKMFSQNLSTNANLKNNSLAGTHTYEQLHAHLMNYIDKFIICSNCNNPETTYILSKKSVKLQCKACSGLTKLEDNLKLTKYISTKLSASDKESQ